MAAPTDQRAGVRPISFLLDAGGGSLSDPVMLKVRPEDLTRTEPSRITVHQTLGRDRSGWADNFGAGLPTVTIAGHTGWRDTGTGEDGVKAFERLNTLVMHSYHAAKQAAITSGLDPAAVKLIFVDLLDDFAWNVAPMQFTLRRSKSRPLLVQYNIVLQAIDTSADSPLRLPGPFASLPAGLDSLMGSIEAFARAINDVIDGVKNWIDRTLVAPVRSFLLKTMQLYRTVSSTIRNGLSIGDQLIGVARMVTAAAMNIFRTFSAVASIPSLVKAKFMEVAAEYGNIFCLLNNALRGKQVYEDFSSLYGSSYCSSTTGGRARSALANANAFDAIFPAQTSFPVQVTPAARTSIAAAAATDVVMAPMSKTEAGSHLRAISDGMVVA